VRGESACSPFLFEVICISLIYLWLWPFIGNFFAGDYLFSVEMFDIRLDESVMTGYIDNYGRAVGGR
jgi:uncharacterized RDD family membrane protein YckC